ncbi:Sec-independent protein translocase protein TatB [uncultured Thiodictyon sp.]|jgi:sec-independent protein translocase protein TatB|uniref:Sec-independent protein translocase protein TatB n=1 Tax=uncultured Thiodictyon sp. TaxID=1846217 RepID=UPI0025DB9DD7|nr:Sec-independent protein translocase protein TatB [uncultured Thiodictyon sp.]
MFDIGFWELLVVGVVALVVIGPKDLPRVARLAGLWLGRARRTLATVKDEIDREFKAQELQDILNKQAQGNPLQRILEEPVVLPPPAPGADAEPGRHLSEPPERTATKS